MDTVRYTVPATDQPAPDAMAPRPALASLTKQKRVKLRLSAAAFGEACQVMAVLGESLNIEVENTAWLDAESVRCRGGLALMVDLYELQMQPLVLASPDLVTLTMSRCEAHLFWELWVEVGLAPAQVPFLTAVMHELHYLLS